MTKVRNITGAEDCAACIDGWVELAGTTTIGRTTYTRGTAPCKWCELGDRRYLHATDPNKPGGRWQPESNFDGADITTPSTPGRNFKPTTAFLREREHAGIPIPALKVLFPRKIWSPEWPSEPTPPSLLGDLTDPKPPTQAKNKPSTPKPAPPEPASAARTPAQVSQPAAFDEDDIPF